MKCNLYSVSKWCINNNDMILVLGKLRLFSEAMKSSILITNPLLPFEISLS